MGAIRRKSLTDPDARREFPLAEIRIAHIGAHAIGYGVEQPGWRWSTHMGPGAGTSSCPVHLATFRSAVAALRSAVGIVTALSDAGVSVRIGVHTGEIEPMGRDIGGVAVHVVARIMALAGPSEIFVSAVTVGLADGSDLLFEAQGKREIRGLDRPLEVHRLRDRKADLSAGA